MGIIPLWESVLLRAIAYVCVLANVPLVVADSGSEVRDPAFAGLPLPWIIAIVFVVLFTILLSLGLGYWFLKRRRQGPVERPVSEYYELTMPSARREGVRQRQSPLVTYGFEPRNPSLFGNAR